MIKKEKNTNPTDNASDPKDAEIAALNLKINELVGDLQRTRADFENYRKQIEIRENNLKNTTKLATIAKILPLLDDLDRAISIYAELAPMQKSLEKTMHELNLQKMDIIPNQTEFNPDLHDAISMDDADGDKEIIAEVLRPGYYYEQEILRPAMVKVTHQ